MTLLSNRPFFAAASLATLGLLAPISARADPPQARVVEASAEAEAPEPRPSNRLLVAGATMFASSYAISAISGAASLGHRDGQLPELFAPVVGPWIAAWNAGQRKPSDDMGGPANLVVPVLFGVLGLAQDIGAICLVAHFLDRPTPAPTHTASGVHVAPYLGLGSTGVMGTF